MTNGNRQDLLTVSELTAILKEALETTFPMVWVSGEVANVSSPRSGHIYFTLKDEGAQIRAVVWRSTASRLRFELEDGMEIVCGGGLDLYPPRGSYQLVVRNVEPRGLGALQKAFQQLQQRLAAEGVFDPRHKKQLPKFPRCIAFVTSPTGAAIRDFCEVVRRRWRGTDILVIPARVQGTGAADEIAIGIETANRLNPRPDILVVGRGGGSLEDLWCFNEEQVVRAIFASRIPVVSAVGHEIDVTLADMVADVRALTPSEAAELVVPSRDELFDGLGIIERRLAASLRARLASARARLESIERSRTFRRPLDRIRDRSRMLDEFESRLSRSIQNRLREAQRRLAAATDHLESLNPLAVLARGYSVTEQAPDEQAPDEQAPDEQAPDEQAPDGQTPDGQAPDGQIVTSSQQLQIGSLIRTRFQSGLAVSRVERVVHETDDE